MQSEDSLRKLGVLDRELIEHRIRTIFERRAQGDMPGIIEYAAEDIHFHVQGDWTLYPFSRPAPVPRAEKPSPPRCWRCSRPRMKISARPSTNW